MPVPYRFVAAAPLWVAAMLCLTGCDALVDRSRASASLTQRAFTDGASAWGDLFTYHPAQPAAKPQTRYCYKMASDVVCYDSVQPGLTAKLVGYQDDDKVSWIQPGGGSLGASGGNPVALSPRVSAPPTNIIEYRSPLMSTPVQETGRRGEIISTPLPPR